MRNTTTLIAASAALALLSTPAVRAQSHNSGLFLDLDVGWNQLNDVDVDSLDIPLEVTMGEGEILIGEGSTTVSGGSIDVNAGMRFGLGIGYEMKLGKSNNCLSFGLASGLLYNTFEDFELGSASVMDRTLSARLKADGGIYQIPLMFNVTFSHHFKSGLSPYVGAGAGAMFDYITSDNLELIATIDGEALEPVELDGGSDDLDVVFGYQLFAGIQYAFSGNAVMGLGYKFLASEGPSWDFGGDTAIEADSMLNHSIVLSLLLRF